MTLHLRYFLALIFGLVFSWQSSIAQDSSANAFITVWSDIKYSANDAVYVGKEISSLSTKSVLIGAGIISGTALSFLFDEEVRSLFNKNYSGGNDGFSAINGFGNLYYAGAFSGAVYLGGLAFGSEEVRTTGRLLMESLLLSGVTVSVLKFSIGRSRPYNNLGHTDFRWFEIEDKYESLPSGHSAVAFSMASVIAGRIDKWWAYPICYSFAGMTAFARIHYDKHWLSDVLMGSAIGIISGNVINAAEENRKNNKNHSRLQITPYLNGLNVVYLF
jgi:membrane-associated phospholipid phosphatase